MKEARALAQIALRLLSAGERELAKEYWLMSKSAYHDALSHS